MPISLKAAAGGGGRYNRLAAGNVIQLDATTSSATYSNTVTVSNVNISAALTEMVSVNVPVGELIVIKLASISSLNTTSNTLSVELEVDGLVVASASEPASTSASRQFIGASPSGGAQPGSATITDIEVRSNFKIRARKLLSTAATISVNFAKIKV